MGQIGLLCTPHTWKSETKFFLLIRPPLISKVDAIKYKSDGLPILDHFKMAAIDIGKSRFVP